MPDLILYNGTILTMNPEHPQAEAIAVRGERILDLGSTRDMLSMRRPDTIEIDLKGRTLLPGFHDAHLHLTQHGLELRQLKLHDVGTLEEGLALVKARAENTPAGDWILGAGFSTARWNVSTLTKEQLDTVAPNHPVLLRSQDHHSAWANSRALELSSVTPSTPEPENGVIVRDDKGEPTGMLLERALNLVWDKLPMPSPAELQEALRLAGEDLASLGITTVHHMAAEPPEYWREMALAASDERYPLRVWACIDQENAEHAAAIGLATGQGGARFTVGGAKFFADGALGSLTAWMLEPYPGTDTVGIPVHGSDVLAERFPIIINAGLTPVIHAIGDAANRAVLEALEATQTQWQAKGLRPRIEHVQHLHPDDIARFQRMGVTASMQAEHLTFDAKRIKELLSDRLERVYLIRSLVAAGVPLAFGSDTPVANPDVRRGLLAACRRLGEDGEALTPAEALSPLEALAAYTQGAAHAIGREERSGMLKPGYDADMVILSHNPLESLDDLTIDGTILAGRFTHALAS